MYNKFYHIFYTGMEVALMIVMAMFHVCHQPEVDLVRIIYVLHVYVA